MRLKMLVTSRMKITPTTTQLEKKKKAGKKKDLSQLSLLPKFTKANQTVSPKQASAWKKSRLKLEGIKALVDDGYLRE
jgi:hypothetical protein